MNIKAVEFLNSMLVQEDYAEVELLTDELLFIKFKCYDLPLTETEESLYDMVEIVFHDALICKGYNQRDNEGNDFVWVLK